MARREREHSMALPTVTVFGAGIAGLTVAHELAERGFTVQVVEPEESQFAEYQCQVGGLAANQFARARKPLLELHEWLRFDKEELSKGEQVAQQADQPSLVEQTQPRVPLKQTIRFDKHAHGGGPELDLRDIPEPTLFEPWIIVSNPFPVPPFPFHFLPFQFFPFQFGSLLNRRRIGATTGTGTASPTRRKSRQFSTRSTKPRCCICGSTFPSWRTPSISGQGRLPTRSGSTACSRRSNGTRGQLRTTPTTPNLPGASSLARLIRSMSSAIPIRMV